MLHNLFAKLYIAARGYFTQAIMFHEWRKMGKMAHNVAKSPFLHFKIHILEKNSKFSFGDINVRLYFIKIFLCLLGAIQVCVEGYTQNLLL